MSTGHHRGSISGGRGPRGGRGTSCTGLHRIEATLVTRVLAAPRNNPFEGARCGQPCRRLVVRQTRLILEVAVDEVPHLARLESRIVLGAELVAVSQAGVGAVLSIDALAARQSSM